MTGEAVGDLGSKSTVDSSSLDEGRASDGNEGSIDLAALRGLEGVVGGGQLDGLAVNGAGKDGESLDGQSRVLLGARGDELGSQGVDLVDGERGVKRLSEGSLLQVGTDVRGVTGLNGQDGSSGSEVGLAHDVGSSAEVGGNTNTLEDGGGSQEALGVSDTKGVLASSDGGGTGGLEALGEEVDVVGLILGNALDVVVDGRVGTSGSEVSLSEVGKTGAVESVLEVLESQGVVKDDS